MIEFRYKWVPIVRKLSNYVQELIFSQKLRKIFQPQFLTLIALVTHLH